MTASLDWNRVENLVAERIAARFLDAMDNGLSEAVKKMERRVVDKAANRLAERFASGPEPSTQSMAEQIVEKAAHLAIQQQKEEKRQEERRRMVRAIGNPKVPHLLEELRKLAESEASGKVKGAHLPLLNTAFREFGSYTLVLREVESGPIPAA